MERTQKLEKVMKLLDGKALSLRRIEALKEKISTTTRDRGLRPGLAVIRIGDDPASKIYVGKKVKTCKDVGMHSEEILMPASASEVQVLEEIARLNVNAFIHGILVQLPLPKHLSEEKILGSIRPSKDVDGFHPLNRGLFLSGLESFVPCTPLGVMHLLKEYQIETRGKWALVIGRSLIVGRPMSILLDRAGATVTVAHSQTQNLEALLLQTDIVVAAIGKPHFISEQRLKPGVVLIDVGINRLPDGKLVGDIDFERYKSTANAITPVPGGIGPMTISTLLENTWMAFEKSL